MPDAEIRERVKVCRRYDELKSYGNGEKRIAKLCSEFPFLSNASNVANLVKMWKARYKKFNLDFGNTKIQTSRRHKGRVVIMQRVHSSHTKKKQFGMSWVIGFSLYWPICVASAMLSLSKYFTNRCLRTLSFRPGQRVLQRGIPRE